MRLWREGLWAFGREVGKMGARMGEPGEVGVRQRKMERLRSPKVSEPRENQNPQSRCLG